MDVVSIYRSSCHSLIDMSRNWVNMFLGKRNQFVMLSLTSVQNIYKLFFVGLYKKCHVKTQQVFKHKSIKLLNFLIIWGKLAYPPKLLKRSAIFVSLLQMVILVGFPGLLSIQELSFIDCFIQSVQQCFDIETKILTKPELYKNKNLKKTNNFLHIFDFLIRYQCS